MKEKRIIQPGSVFGLWTVDAPAELSPRGEERWLCRCACGTQREVLARALRYALSESCGCQTRERASRKNAMDLTGKVFGDLTVVSRAPKAGVNGGARWLCRCVCGAECTYLGTLLATGKKTHCGCKSVKNYAYTDIAGQRFNCLTALYRLDDADAYGSVLWHCRCDCGNETDVSYNALMYSNTKSCGCKKKEHDKALSSLLTRVDGTSLDMIKSDTIPKNNTTGVRGVYWIKGKYVAKIVFQKKQYFLGRYDDLDSAREARQEAEEILRDKVVAHYDRWKAIADADPQWAAENPIRILVNKSPAGQLQIDVLPALEAYEPQTPLRMII